MSGQRQLKLGRMSLANQPIECILQALAFVTLAGAEPGAQFVDIYACQSDQKF